MRNLNIRKTLNGQRKIIEPIKPLRIVISVKVNY